VLNSSLLHDRDTCWERKENNCTVWRAEAREAQWQSLGFTPQSNEGKIRTKSFSIAEQTQEMHRKRRRDVV